MGVFSSLYSATCILSSVVSAGAMAYAAFAGDWAQSAGNPLHYISLYQGWTATTPLAGNSSTSALVAQLPCLEAENATRLVAADSCLRWTLIAMALALTVFRQVLLPASAYGPDAGTSERPGFIERFNQFTMLSIGCVLTQCTVLTLQMQQGMVKAASACDESALTQLQYEQGDGFYLQRNSLFAIGTVAAVTLYLASDLKKVAWVGPFALSGVLFVVGSFAMAENSLDWIVLPDEYKIPHITRDDGSSFKLSRRFGIRVAGTHSADGDCQEHTEALRLVGFFALAAVAFSGFCVGANASISAKSKPDLKRVIAPHVAYVLALVLVYLGFSRWFMLDVPCAGSNALVGESFDLGKSFYSMFSLALLSEAASLGFVLVRLTAKF